MRFVNGRLSFRAAIRRAERLPGRMARPYHHASSLVFVGCEKKSAYFFHQVAIHAQQ
jgi:hypothetical protein